ncbi:hypothetical protein Tco_0612802, partial [Tanacetum coccineum]
KVEEYVLARVVNEVKNQLPHVVSGAVLDFIRLRLESIVLSILKTQQINLFTRPTTTTENLTTLEMKLKLVIMMEANPQSIDSHECHTAFYNTLMDSIALDEIEAMNDPIQEDALKKIPHDDQDPLENHEGEKKWKYQKLVGESSSRKALVTTESTFHETQPSLADQPYDLYEHDVPNVGSVQCPLVSQ